MFEEGDVPDYREPSGEHAFTSTLAAIIYNVDIVSMAQRQNEQRQTRFTAFRSSALPRRTT